MFRHKEAINPSKYVDEINHRTEESKTALMTIYHLVE
jgi:hypothetical protein